MRLELLLDGQSDGHLDLDRECTFVGIERGTIHLACGDGGPAEIWHAIWIDLAPGVAATVLTVDDRVRLRAHARGGIDGTFFLALHDAAGDLLLAYARAEALPSAATDADDPGDLYPSSDFFAPLTLSGAWPCAPDCAPPGGHFVVESCCPQRGAVDFGYAGRTVRVHDQGREALVDPVGLDLRVLAYSRELCEDGTAASSAWTTIFAWRVP